MKNERPSFSSSEILGSIDQAVKKDFETHRRILSFEEYLGLIEENPKLHTRGIAQYAVDMMDHFGTETPVAASDHGEHQHPRFKLFDFPIDGIAPKVVGHESVQNHLYKTLKAFARQGINNKLILLHGPN